MREPSGGQGCAGGGPRQSGLSRFAVLHPWVGEVEQEGWGGGWAGRRGGSECGSLTLPPPGSPAGVPWICISLNYGCRPEQSHRQAEGRAESPLYPKLTSSLFQTCIGHIDACCPAPPPACYAPVQCGQHARVGGWGAASKQQLRLRCPFGPCDPPGPQATEHRLCSLAVPAQGEDCTIHEIPITQSQSFHFLFLLPRVQRDVFCAKCSIFYLRFIYIHTFCVPNVRPVWKHDFAKSVWPNGDTA